MGSLGYVVGGMAAGLGQGLEAVGKNALDEQKQAKIEQLRADNQAKLQQAGFAQQEKMEGKRETFETGLRQQEIAGRSAVAQAEIGSKEKVAAAHEAGSTARTHEIVQGRLGVARTNADAKGAAAKQPKPWQMKNVNTGYPMGPDGKPNFLAGPQQTALLQNPNTGALYVQMGDKLVRWNSATNKPAIDSKALNRVPIDPTELERLHRDPMGVIPGGYKGGGLTNAENFERLHHYLPSTVLPRLTQGGMVNDKTPAATGETGGSSDSSAEEYEDRSVAEGSDPYGTKGEMPSSSPDDTKPAE